MTSWHEELESALDTFRAKDELEVGYLPAPHQPAILPAGKMAVFGFWGDGEWLLISRCGPNSNTRYQSQHYSLHGAPSTLAKKLADDSRMRSVHGFDRHAPGDWMKSSSNRFNILVDASPSRDLLVQLKTHLIEVLQPRYDG